MTGPQPRVERDAGYSDRVVVLVTSGCHLCEDACKIVSRICEESGVSWSASDLSDVDEATRSQWREYVPVVLVDGEVHDIFRVTPERLRAKLVG